MGDLVGADVVDVKARLGVVVQGQQRVHRCMDRWYSGLVENQVGFPIEIEKVLEPSFIDKTFLMKVF